MSKKHRVNSPVQHPVAELFALSTLDFVIELASVVHFDFYWRSEKYAKVSEETAEKILAFRFHLGSHPNWPDNRQRSSVYKILSKDNQLCSHAVSFRLAASALSKESNFPETGPFLQPFLDSAGTMRAYVRNNEGRALVVGVQKIRALFETSVAVLTDPEVSRVFNVDEQPQPPWPLGGIIDSNGACLLTNINDAILRSSRGKINPSVVYAKQRIAHYGALTINNILNESSYISQTEVLSELVKDSHSWSRALADLVPHYVRYWKNPHELQKLSEEEKSQIPENPAGRVDAQNIFNFTASYEQTATGGDICCCDTVNFCDTDQDDCFAAEVTTIDTDEGHVSDYECEAGG